MDLSSTSSLKSLYNYLQGLVEKRLWLKVLLSIVVGAVVGFCLNPAFGFVSEKYATDISNWLSLPGTLFLKLVQMIMIPLIISSIIKGLVEAGNLDVIKTLGLKILVYFIFTTAVSIVIGFFTYYIINENVSEALFSSSNVSGKDNPEVISENISVPNMISNLLPENPLASMVSGEMLSIVIFAIIVGIALVSLSREASSPIVKLLNSVQDVCMIIVKWAMTLVPIAVFGITAHIVISTGIESIISLSMYGFSVIIGLVILILFYSALVALIGKKNPIRFLSDIKDAQLLAFSTTSSAAVMPLTIKIAQEKLKVKSSVAEFLIPIGTTINMDGTALYQCITVLYLANYYGVELHFTNLIALMITIVSASIGTPAIPGGGIIILASIVQSIGIPFEGIAIIVGIERLLGMFRTLVNVTGDLTASVVFNNLSSINKSMKIN